jgi:energy-coupling factor transporter ATP-binding protein EcfA2
MVSRLELTNITVQYRHESTIAVQGLTLDVAAGHCCAVLGPGASGKSTLLHGIAGSLLPNNHDLKVEGEMNLNGRRFHPLPSTVLFPEVGLVHQESSLMISGMFDSVHEELKLSLENLPLTPNQKEERVHSTIDLLKIQDLEHRNPAQLSGGEQRKVAIATILVAQPQLLLLDEPNVGLDQRSQFDLARLIHQLKGKTTVIFAESTVELALLCADEVVVLDGGRPSFVGGRIEFLNRLGEFQDILQTDAWQNIYQTMRSRESSRLNRLLR